MHVLVYLYLMETEYVQSIYVTLFIRKLDKRVATLNISCTIANSQG